MTLVSEGAIRLVLLALSLVETPMTETRVTLHVGDKRTPAPGLTLRFERVASDSRCPVDVNCVWAGDAVVELKLDAGGEVKSVELHTAANEPTEATHGGFRVRLEKLEPRPRSDRPIARRDYEATLAIRAAAAPTR